MLANRRRKHTHVEVDSEGTWIISYADMITLLLAFFVMFFSTDPKASRAEQLQMALIESLSRGEKDAGQIAQRILSGDGSSPGSMVESVPESLVTSLGATVHEVNGKVLVEFPQISFFRSGEIGLTKEGEEAVIEFAKRYMPFAGSYTLGIQAFTDSKKVIQKRGRKFSDNLELSALRAIETMKAFSRSGIPLSRMRIGGYGELSTTARELASMGSSANVDALSRKVVLSIEPQVDPPQAKRTSKKEVMR